MNRRSFLQVIGAVIGGIALEQAVPFGRVYSFPKEIKCLNILPAEIVDNMFRKSPVFSVLESTANGLNGWFYRAYVNRSMPVFETVPMEDILPAWMKDYKESEIIVHTSEVGEWPEDHEQAI